MVYNDNYNPEGIKVFEEKNAIPILFYLFEHGSCRKMDLYRDVTRNYRVPEVLEMMEDRGMIHQEQVSGKRDSVIISLTDTGRDIVDHLNYIEGVLTKSPVL